MNCGTFKIPTCTPEEWRKKHAGHRITESVHVVKAPGYEVVFDRCEDCSTERHKVEYGRYSETPARKK